MSLRAASSAVSNLRIIAEVASGEKQERPRNDINYRLPQLGETNIPQSPDVIGGCLS